MAAADERQKLVENLHKLEKYQFDFRRILSCIGKLEYQATTKLGTTSQGRQELVGLKQERQQKNKGLKTEFGIRRFELEAEIQKYKSQLDKLDRQDDEPARPMANFERVHQKYGQETKRQQEQVEVKGKGHEH